MVGNYKRSFPVRIESELWSARAHARADSDEDRMPEAWESLAALRPRTLVTMRRAATVLATPIRGVSE